MSQQKNILYICGSLNQTKQMHKIALELNEHKAYFTPFYLTGIWELARKMGLTEMTIGGNKMVERSMNYLREHHLEVDYRGEARAYDLILLCTDQLLPSNIRGKRVVLVQEGIFDPPTLLYYISKVIPGIPLFLAGTYATGQSKIFEKFCVGSEGYKEHFARLGIPKERIAVTGMPNFDNCEEYYNNNFPHKDYVLVCTSDARETGKFDRRKALLKRAVKVAAGRQLVFKLHPNEKRERAEREIKAIAPDALVYQDGSAEEMIANSAVVICQYSSVAFVAMALGKEVHSYFSLEELRTLLPMQNGGTSAKAIADVCREVIQNEPIREPSRFARLFTKRMKPRWEGQS